MLIDFDSCQIVFPTVICPTSDRPDIVFWSVNIKKVIIFELTIPAEELIEEANDRKIAKYTYLKNLITESGWACELPIFKNRPSRMCSRKCKLALVSLCPPFASPYKKSLTSFNVVPGPFPSPVIR